MDLTAHEYVKVARRNSEPVAVYRNTDTGDELRLSADELLACVAKLEVDGKPRKKHKALHKSTMKVLRKLWRDRSNMAIKPLGVTFGKYYYVFTYSEKGSKAAETNGAAGKLNGVLIGENAVLYRVTGNSLYWSAAEPVTAEQAAKIVANIKRARKDMVENTPAADPNKMEHSRAFRRAQARAMRMAKKNKTKRKGQF